MCGLSAESVEPLQVVAYERGQQFKTHHDAGTLSEDDSEDEGEGAGAAHAASEAAPGMRSPRLPRIRLVTPRRLVTFFVYLNSLPPGQGATVFPLLGLEVIVSRPAPERSLELITVSTSFAAQVIPKARKALVFCNVKFDGR